MNYFNKEKSKSNYFLMVIQLFIVVFIFSPIIKPQSQYSGSVKTDKYNFEYQLTNLYIPFKNIFSLLIIKKTKVEDDSLTSLPDTIKLVLYLKGFNPSGDYSMWDKFLRYGQKPYIPPFQIYIKGTNGYFKVDDVLAYYEFRNSVTKELFMSPVVTKNKDRETLTNTTNPKFAIEDAVELFINACWNKN